MAQLRGATLLHSTAPILATLVFKHSHAHSSWPAPLAGYSEEQAVEQLSGTVDVYVSKFRPMRHTLSGRDERTLMKLLVHAESGRVVGCHM